MHSKDVASLAAGGLDAGTEVSRKGASLVRVSKRMRVHHAGIRSARTGSRARLCGRALRLVGVGAIALGMLVSGEAFSSGECGRVALPAGLKTLCPNTPALASDLNDNFRQLARWMSDRLGALADSNIVSANISAAHISSSGRLSAGGNPGDPVVVDVRACSGSDCCPPGYSSSLGFSKVILCRLYAD